eukprot:gene65-91_t
MAHDEVPTFFTDLFLLTNVLLLHHGRFIQKYLIIINKYMQALLKNNGAGNKTTSHPMSKHLLDHYKNRLHPILITTFLLPSSTWLILAILSITSCRCRPPQPLLTDESTQQATCFVIERVAYDPSKKVVTYHIENKSDQPVTNLQLRHINISQSHLEQQTTLNNSAQGSMFLPAITAHGQSKDCLFNIDFQEADQARFRFEIACGEKVIMATEEVLINHEAIHRAVEKAAFDQVKFFLAHGVDINRKSSLGYTLLYTAIKHGDEQICQLLIDQKADINNPSNLSCTPLYQAIEKEHQRIAELLLSQAHIQVNIADDFGITPIHLAIQKGNKALVERLLNQEGIQINTADRWGSTPLHAAIDKGSQEVIKLLLTSNKIQLNLDTADREGRTALSIAQSKGDQTTIKLIENYKRSGTLL